MSDTKFHSVLAVVTVVYFGASKLLFEQINEASDIIIDEEFHIPQGLAYCQNNFTHWDNKITTLPGLYLVSSSIVSNFFTCSAYYLRLVNLIASAINLFLFASILNFVYGLKSDNIAIVLQAVNLSILPPLYFFSHVYYTDTLSMCACMIFFRLCLMSKNKMIIFSVAVLSILMRQTNVVWVAMVLGHRVLDVFIRSSRVYGNSALNKQPNSTLNKYNKYLEEIDKSKLKKYYDILDFYAALRYHFCNYLKAFFKYLTFEDWKIIFTHCSVILMFIIFVYFNGSVVVGDKSAHEATIHSTQMLYFLIFYGVFALPYVINNLFRTLRLMYNSKYILLLISVVFLLIVHFNTIIHPYLLADNRHYTFYIFNRWFNKYWFAKYATVPAYVFLFFNLYTNLKDQNCISFLLPCSVCIFASMGLQTLTDIRYFLLPYIILRLRFARPNYTIIISEFLLYMLINGVTFYVFFNKTFMWDNYREPQRIIW